MKCFMVQILTMRIRAVLPVGLVVLRNEVGLLSLLRFCSEWLLCCIMTM